MRSVLSISRCPLKAWSDRQIILSVRLFITLSGRPVRRVEPPSRSGRAHRRATGTTGTGTRTHAGWTTRRRTATRSHPRPGWTPRTTWRAAWTSWRTARAGREPLGTHRAAGRSWRSSTGRSGTHEARAARTTRTAWWASRLAGHTGHTGHAGSGALLRLSGTHWPLLAGVPHGEHRIARLLLRLLGALLARSPDEGVDELARKVQHVVSVTIAPASSVRWRLGQGRTVASRDAALGVSLGSGANYLARDSAFCVERSVAMVTGPAPASRRANDTPPPPPPPLR